MNKFREILDNPITYRREVAEDEVYNPSAIRSPITERREARRIQHCTRNPKGKCQFNNLIKKTKYFVSLRQPNDINSTVDLTHMYQIDMALKLLIPMEVAHEIDINPKKDGKMVR